MYRCPSCKHEEITIDRRIVGKDELGFRVVEECFRCLQCDHEESARKDDVAFDALVARWYVERPPKSG